MNTKHTPGPWVFAYGSVYQGDENSSFGESPNGNAARIALMDRHEPKTSPCERDANARLIAAAPALLAQLQALAVQLESCGMIVPPGVTQAIAQATGQEISTPAISDNLNEPLK